MADAIPPGYALPKPQGPRTIGALNITFGILLLLWGVCANSYILLLPTFFSAIEAQQKALQAQVESRRKAQLKSLEEQEKAAQTERAKADLQAQRAAVQSQQMPPMPEYSFFNKMGYDDPRVIGHYVGDMVTNLVLNALLIASGIGLLQLRAWARKLGLWVAALKIARLLALTASAIFLVIPITTRKMVEMMTAMAAQGGPGPARSGIPELAQMMGIYSTAWAIGLLVLGSIYPAIVLWLLSRPGARAACLAARQAPEAAPKGEILDRFD